MKKQAILGLMVISIQANAFDFKALVDKVSKDKDTQEKIKDAAKKGYEYFKGDKKTATEETKKEEVKTEVAKGEIKKEDSKPNDVKKK